MNGLLLLGDGKGGFSPQSIQQSGLYVPGNAKALIKLKGPGNSLLLAAAQNRGDLKVFKLRTDQKLEALKPTDKKVTYTLNNGKTRTEEVYFGNSSLSQSSQFIQWNKSIQKIEITDNKGATRTAN
jgi:hypothetical protein